MKRVIATILVVSSVLVASASSAMAPEVKESGIGYCDPIAPFCYGGRPVCVCNYTMQCWWSCR